MTEADPSGKSSKEPGAKLDAGKPAMVRGALQYFRNALFEVGALSAHGAEKYSWNGWENVPDGFNRYTEALGRHLASEADGPYDEDWKKRGKEVLHATAVAWNALARLELLLREMKEKGAAGVDAGLGMNDTGIYIPSGWTGENVGTTDIGTIIDKAPGGSSFRQLGRRFVNHASHRFTKKIHNWWCCAHCGLVLLRNDATRKAAKAPCDK